MRSKLTLRASGSYDRGVPARLPLAAQRLVIVTGKGGVGKSAVTAALARAVAGARRRGLAGEGTRGGLGPLLGMDKLGPAPTGGAPRLQATPLEPEAGL